MVPNIVWLQIWSPTFAEKQVKTIFGGHTKKRSVKCARQLFSQVWGNLGKNLLHPQTFACSYTYVVYQWQRPSQGWMECKLNMVIPQRLQFEAGTIRLRFLFRMFSRLTTFPKWRQHSSRRKCVNVWASERHPIFQSIFWSTGALDWGRYACCTSCVWKPIKFSKSPGALKTGLSWAMFGLDERLNPCQTVSVN